MCLFTGSLTMDVSSTWLTDHRPHNTYRSHRGKGHVLERHRIRLMRPSRRRRLDGRSSASKDAVGARQVHTPRRWCQLSTGGCDRIPRVAPWSLRHFRIRHRWCCCCGEMSQARRSRKFGCPKYIRLRWHHRNMPGQRINPRWCLLQWSDCQL
jgi:hypothetical protein